MTGAGGAEAAEEVFQASDRSVLTVINLFSIRDPIYLHAQFMERGDAGSDPAVSFLTKGVLRLFHVGIVMWQRRSLEVLNRLYAWINDLYQY